jgi:hypothetical protein
LLQHVYAFHRHQSVSGAAVMHIVSLLICRLPSARTDINYYHCEQIFALLEKAEAEQQAGGGKSLKSFFGRYNSTLLAAWDDILQTYRKESVYLAEAARIMVQNVQYEMCVHDFFLLSDWMSRCVCGPNVLSFSSSFSRRSPTMKKSLAESERTIVELNRKRVTFERSAETFAAKFEAACAKLNISSAASSAGAVGDLRAEIERSGRGLEAAIDAIQRRVAASALLAESADFYETFVRFQLRASLGDKVQYAASRVVASHCFVCNSQVFLLVSILRMMRLFLPSARRICTSPAGSRSSRRVCIRCIFRRRPNAWKRQR